MKHFLVSFALLFLPFGSWAQEYSLWVGGVQVTSENALNITGEHVDGSVSFDAVANTLTLNNATVTGTTTGGGCIISGMSGLTISLVGENTLNCSSDSCSAIRAGVPENVEPIGGEKTLTITKGSADCSLSIRGERAIRDFSSISVQHLCWDGEYTYEYASVNSQYGSHTGMMLVNADGGEAGNVILNAETPYDLWVGGVQVTSSNASNVLDELNAEEEPTVVFDALSNTLTLYDATISVNGNNAIESGLDNLTVFLAGSSTITCHGNEDCVFKGTGSETVTFSTNSFAAGDLFIQVYDEEQLFTDITPAYSSGLTIKNEGWSYTIKIFLSGTGTSEDPLLIKNAADLKILSDEFNNGNIVDDVCVLLNNDIDCSEVEGFSPIGNSDSPFLGTFDGNHKTISGLTYTSEESNAGLFDILGDESQAANVKDLKLKDCSFRGAQHTGGIAAILANGTIENCTVSTSSINSAAIDVDVYAGGIVGEVTGGTITGCMVKDTVWVGSEGSGVLYSGAIIGKKDSNAALTNNYYNGSVTTCTTPEDEFGTEKSGYQTRGTGEVVGIFQDVDCYDIIENNGAMLYTQKVTIDRGVNCGLEFVNEYYDPLSDPENSIYYFAPADIVTLHLYPDEGYMVSSVSLTYTPEGANEPTVEQLENGAYSDDEYIYEFEVPDAEATINATVEEIPITGLIVGGVRVIEDNADNIFGEDFATAVFDYTSNTLTLRGCHFLDYVNSFITVGSDIEALTVHLIGYNEIGYHAQKVFAAANPFTINVTTDATVPGKLIYITSNSDENALTDDNVTLSYGNGLAMEEDDYQCVISVADAKNVSYFGTSQFHDAEEGSSQYAEDGYPSWDYTGWYYSDAVRTNENTDLPPTVVSTEGDDGQMARMRSYGWDIIKSLTFQCVPVFIESTVQVAMMSLDGETTYATGTLTDGSVTLAPTAQVTYDDVCLTFTSENSFSFVPMAVKTVVPESYGIEIGGEAVTELNYTDVFGDNTVSYDIETNTLTLNNATIAADPYRECPGITYDGDENLTIMLIGSNTVQGSGGCEGIRNNGSGTLIFTTDEDKPGKLVCIGEYPLFEESTNVEYDNGLGLSTTAEGQMIGYFRSYDLWVLNNRVTSVNKENILGDANATVRFNPQTSTLSLYGVSIGDIEETDTIVSTSLPSLTVDLHGNNTIKFKDAGFRSRNTETIASLNFTTSENNPGQLSWDTDEGDLAEGFDVTYTSPLELQPSGKLISETEIVNYDLMVGATTINSVNCTDVLGDGTVKYIEDGHVLVLDNAYLNNIAIMSNLTGGLTIHLLGENYIYGTENLITTSVENAMIVFTVSDTTPGSLTLTKTDDEGTWISGFTAASVPNDYATTTDGNTMVIARPVPISPIIAETENGEKPETEKPTEDFGWETWGLDDDTYVNIVIDNVLYTLKAGDYNQGDWDDPEDPSGVNLSEIPSDMEDVLTKTPGSDDFANAFKGLTIEVPEGNGQIMLKGEIGTNAKLGVKIGDNEPFIFPNEEYPEYNKLETLYIPYSCSTPTFVYIYLAGYTPTSSRTDGTIRGRVLVGHIKISNVGASSSMIVSNNSYSAQTNTISNRIIAYDMPASAKTPDNIGIVMSTVGVESIVLPSRAAESADSRARQPRKTIEQRRITELGTSVFDSVDKDQILYIDLSETDIKDMTVNRNTGRFEGFGQNAIFYLPADNDDGGDDNVVLGDKCASLNLVDDMDFRAPKDFTAANAVLDREFNVGQTSTVFLPFALSKEQADGLGAFHTFKEIQGANAVFNEAEADGIAANTPYIFLPSVTKIETTNVSVEGLDDFQAVSGNMVGTYEELIWADEQTDIFGFAASDIGDVVAGEFVRVGAGAWLPPFRAFMQVNSSAPSRLNIVVGEVTTGIFSTNTDSQPSTSTPTWYTISGQRLTGKPAMKGLYINNGKKINIR